MARAHHTTHAQGAEKLKGHLAMVFFAAFIAGSFSLGKLTTPYIGPAALNGARFVLAALIMGVLAFGVRRETLKWPPASWRFVLLGFCMAVYFVTMFMALALTSPVSTSAVFTLTPIMTAIFAYFLLSQNVRWAAMVSLLCAGIGSIWVIFRGDYQALAGFEIGAGELIFLAGCACYALFTALLRKFNRGESLPVSTFYILIATTIWVGLYGFGEISRTDWASLPPLVWFVLLYLAIFTTAITLFLVQYASLRLPASKVQAYGYLVPAFVIAYEGLAGHGWVSLTVMAGAIVTVLGMVILALVPDK